MVADATTRLLMIPPRSSLAALLLPLGFLQAENPASFSREQLDFFESKVRPVLAESCMDCHGAKRHENGLRLDGRAEILKGSDYGPVVDVTKPADSKLLRAMRHAPGVEPMPKKGAKLAEAQIEAIAQWIGMGLPWPAEKTALAQGHSAPDWKSHWAFQPLLAPKERNLDAIVEKNLRAAGLDFAPTASPETRIRRLFVDLIGLQPSAAELKSLSEELQRQPQAAWSRLVNRLLSLPAHGQRWARHWLDVARYADTDGYQVAGRNILYPFAYTYRDWVIRALNADMPYDRFVSLQLAADRIVPAGDKSHPDLAALGFLSVGDKFISDRALQIDDRIDVIGRGLLGLTIACARCHNHKYDPIPSADYYAMYSMFNSSEQPDSAQWPVIGKPADEKAHAEYLAKLEDIAKRELKFKAEVHREIRELDNLKRYLAFTLEMPNFKERTARLGRAGQLKLRDSVADQWEKFIRQYSEAKPVHPVLLAWQRFAQLPTDAFAAKSPAVSAELCAPGSTLNPVLRNELQKRPPPKSMQDISGLYAEVFLTALDGREPDNADWRAVRGILQAAPSPLAVAADQTQVFFTRKDLDTITKLGNDRVRLESEHPGAPPRAMVTYDKPKPNDVRIFVRGNPARQGDPAPRAWLTAFGGDKISEGSGRLEWARKITSRDNPLTARVIANRLWMLHFGKPLVAQPSDFGVQTAKPKQQELLDFLAWELMQQNWSLKHLHRLITQSRTWQQSSEVSAQKALKDADNEWLSRYNRQRLDFEAMRDALLQTSGELDLNLLSGRALAHDDAQAIRRRSVLLMVNRYDQPTVPAMFDFANPDSHSPMRYVTSVPSQALFLLNSPFMISRATQTAAGIKLEPSGVESRAIHSLYQKVLRRLPGAHEVEQAQRFCRDAEGLAGRPQPFQWQYGMAAVLGDAKQGWRMGGFTALAHFDAAKSRHSPEAKFPSPKFGHLFIAKSSGHPGRDAASVMRWRAPSAASLQIGGQLKRSSPQGDGIRGFIFSDQRGLLAQCHIKGEGSAMLSARLEARAGELFSLVVDRDGDTNSDGYQFNPRIERLTDDGSTALLSDSAQDFCDSSGWPINRTRPIAPLTQLAQVLLMSNEFMFVD